MFLILLLVLVVLIAVILRRNSDYWKKRGIVQEDGVIWKFVFGNCSLAEVYKSIYDKYSEPNVGIFLASKPALLLRDLENVQTVLAGDFQSFYSRGISFSPDDKLADNVLFIEDFGRWKVIRQKISPVFTTAKLKNMFYILDRCARDFSENIADHVDFKRRPFNCLYTYTAASIGASVFGIDTKTKNTMDSPFLDMTSKATSSSFIGNLLFTFANTFPTLFKYLGLKAFGQYEKFFIDVVRNVMESRKKDTVNRHDFIDICLQIQEQGVMKDSTTGYELEPSVEILAAQAFFFFVAGVDTSATTLHFTLIELSNNPDILKRVHKEIDTVFEGCDDKLTYNDVEKLQYLEMVVNEAMRKFPPIGLIQRKCTKSTTLPVGNVKLVEGDLCIIPVYGIHRDERYYQNSELFDPDRFSPENISKLPKFGYLPFGEGNRICLGKHM